MSSLLRRRFDLSKCKTLLQLASKRLKVLRNIQALAVKTARGDVAKLLEKNKDSDAKLQVEALFREEKKLILYDLLDQFCQLIIDGLESIKSQKECPSNLREAVASLIFAALHCAELEEFKLVSKQFKAKYGSDFCKAAKELRPDSGVNQQVIQVFSSHSVSSDEKLKLLKEIAVENKINWDHEMTIIDASVEATDLIKGPKSFASAAKLSQVETHPINEKQKSKSMHVNELNRQGNAVLQNAIGSRTMSAANPLGLPLHAAHQFAKNVGTMGSAMVADHILHTPVLDPYALARAEGKMDYKVVSEYMKRSESMELNQENRGGMSYERIATQLPERKQSHNGVMDAARYEDALQKSKGRLPRRRHDLIIAHRRNEEEELLELQNATEYAFVTANQAVEAARAAVTMVRMESLERSRSKQSRDENYKNSQMDSMHSSDRHRLSHEEEADFEPSQHDWMVGDQVSAMISPYYRDAGEDSLKYVVFEQTSGSQNSAPSSAHAEGYNKNANLNVSPEVWNEPTLYFPDRIIFDAEHEEAVSKEVTTQILFESFRSDSMQEQDLDKNASFSNNEESNHTENHQNKHVPVPQFDDYSSDEDGYVQENLSALPQGEGHISEEANEEEEPFYLRGRAALATEDYANVTARASVSEATMLMSTISSSTDEGSEDSSINMASSEHDSTMHNGFGVEPLGVSNDKEQDLVMDTSRTSTVQHEKNEGSQKSSSDDHEELESLSARREKAPFRHQIDTTKFTGESSVMNSVAHKERSVKPMTPRKLKWAASIYEEWDLDPNYHEPVSPLGSVKLSSPNGNKDPSSQVNQKLNWPSGASEDSESVSDRSFDVHKQQEFGLDSPKSFFTMEDATKMRDATQVPQPSTPRPFTGVSKRSVRSTRSRQTQDANSVSSGNEDMFSP